MHAGSGRRSRPVAQQVAYPRSFHDSNEKRRTTTHGSDRLTAVSCGVTPHLRRCPLLPLKLLALRSSLFALSSTTARTPFFAYLVSVHLCTCVRQSPTRRVPSTWPAHAHGDFFADEDHSVAVSYGCALFLLLRCLARAMFLIIIVCFC